MRRQSLFRVLLVAGMINGFFAGSLTGQASVEVTIDARAPKSGISPYIYGKNNSLSDNSSSPVTAATWQRYRDAGITIFRESGGNNSTKYNWRKKLSSHPDWYNNVYAHDWDFAARSLQQNLPAAQGMWTLPLLGWAASDKSNNFNDWGFNSSKGWSGVHQNLAGGGTVNPDGGSKALQAGDPTKYLEPWPADSMVGILKKWMGEGGLGYDPSHHGMQGGMEQFMPARRNPRSQGCRRKSGVPPPPRWAVTRKGNRGNPRQPLAERQLFRQTHHSGILLVSPSDGLVTPYC